ncbi:MAG: argininosuccinate lyase, partial [Dehalococcoidia bacterium]|nr:argininosuccinate lyase [Dehalococcoidia bacterium]
RDMQEDKERVFDTLDTLDLSLHAFAEMIRTVKVNVGRVRAAFRKDYVLATDLADYLVKKGLPFREAHRVVSELSIYAMNNDRCFRELTLSEYNKFSPLFGQDVYDITLESSIAARNTPGGTSLRQVQIALARARQLVERTA